MGKQYDDSLSFILDGEAENFTEERCTDLTPTANLRAVWRRWGELVSEAFYACPETKDVSLPDDADYDVFMTLDGQGVGIWDGRWDSLFDNKADLKRVESRLKHSLHGAYLIFKRALENEVYEQCEEE